MKGKTIFITGGNEGIGLATALLFAKEGANVAITGRREAKNAEALEAIQAMSASAIAITGDVSVEADVAGAVAATVEEFGGLDYAFNNAGVMGEIAPTPDVSADVFDQLMAINVRGTWLCMKHELPAMVASGGGVIVNCGSIATHNGLPMLSPYCTSKAAVAGMTKSVAVEYSQQGVRVNAVCPGGIGNTGIQADVHKNMPEVEEGIVTATPMARLGRPEEIAGAVLFLCSDAATFITGELVNVDGGFNAP